ncbi:hypothetical protein [Desulforamulus hydrothermalis]|uniref:Uncharacterized protein n=1 Tax=Desulforamulus hydrothermalis Lam5 = DSM 18033 TaxID=1121428 RepID=K8EI33_9FIRM|nr:hypothetical protein [Desulforamulus hydrothermalis]CCO08281.1 conserved hypothetical protein [Desulforamulus hydrothermalis Lam5 = DSM 18033]SHH37608.1 hypothetical protein SAMN02745177_02347 [Desulforamulus hydrothermalis Lam5 = DSM 18033]
MITQEGLEKIAAMIAGLQSPFIAIGDGNGEKFRKAVGAVITSGPVVRFRTSLSLSEGNGDHTYLALFSDAASGAGTGVKIGQVDQLFNKGQTQVLNVECKITVQGV